MAMWNDYEKIARRLDRIANAFERIANALETANIIEADRKTENSSGKPNNCEPKICDTCRYYNSNIPCGSTPSACKEADKFAEKFVDGLKKLKPKVEPQTDCGDFADRLAYERGVKHAWEVAQKVFDSTVTFYEAEDVAKQIDKDINVRSKTEPSGYKMKPVEQTEPQTEQPTAQEYEKWLFKEPQTEYRRVGQAIDSVTGKVLGETYDVPQTDCSWQKGE